VRFEGGIAGSRRAFLGTLAGHDQGAATEKPIVAADQGVRHHDLEVGAAPSDGEVGRDLWKTESGIAGTVAAHNADALWCLVVNGCRRGIGPRHLAGEAAGLPRQE